MGFQALKKIFPLPTAAAVILALYPISAHSGETITPGLAQPSQPEQAPPLDDDSAGFVRRNTWSGSFDKAGDATRNAELELKSSGLTIPCEPDQFKGDGASDQVVQQRVTECRQRAQEVAHFGKDAESIRKMQRNFSLASKASDLAAVGAIGALGYSELMKKDSSQASSLKSVAKIETTAGYASYATGAADIGMGAYALAVQKRKLDKMKKTLSGISASGVQLTSADSALVSKIANAAEKTKSAAMSHMAYGAGKMAVGYATMWMADKNRKQAESLESIDMYAPVATATTSSNYKPTNYGNSASYQNNDPAFSLANGTTVSSDGNPDGAAVGGGASVMPAADSRMPASLGENGGGGSGGSGIGSAGALKSSPGGDSPAAPTADDSASPTKEALGNNFEVALGGGSGVRYGGGGKTDGAEDDKPSTPQVLEAGGSTSKATGVNPESIYQDALKGLDETKGSMAGVSGSGLTLFEVVKAKYNKMMEVGRLQGPGAVEVRN
jgi:hypothetical protein